MADPAKNKTDDSSNDWLMNSGLTVITIGDNIAEFRIHSSLLRTTSFFEVEHRVTSPKLLPKDLASELETAEKSLSQTREDRPQQKKNSDDSLFFDEHEPESETLAEDAVKPEKDDTAIQSSNDLKKPEAKYRFPNKGIFCPASFQIFLSYLYSKTVNVKINDTSVKVFFRSWLIASRYKCTTLQNELMDKVREHYTNNLVTLDSLQWLSQRTSANPQCKLLAYLVEQSAFEALHHADDGPAGGNLHKELFWTANDRPLRYLLFKSIIRVGRNNKSRDPATASGKRWYV